MKNNFILFFLSVCISFSANAHVFKCNIEGKTIYQQAPCPNSDDGQIDLIVDKPANKQIYEAQERVESWQRKQSIREERQRRNDLYNLEVQKTNAVTKQAEATHDDAVAHRKEAAIKQRDLELRRRPILRRDRDTIEKKWDDKIEAIK